MWQACPLHFPLRLLPSLQFCYTCVHRQCLRRANMGSCTLGFRDPGSHQPDILQAAHWQAEVEKQNFMCMCGCKSCVSPTAVRQLTPGSTACQHAMPAVPQLLSCSAPFGGWRAAGGAELAHATTPPHHKEAQAPAVHGAARQAAASAGKEDGTRLSLFNLQAQPACNAVADLPVPVRQPQQLLHLSAVAHAPVPAASKHRRRRREGVFNSGRGAEQRALHMRALCQQTLCQRPPTDLLQ